MKKLILIGCTLIAFAGCYNDSYNKLYPVKVNTCDTTTISYSTNIKPILAQNCINPGCHAAGGGTSGYDYTDTNAVKTNALNGWMVEDINYNPSRGHNNMPNNGTHLSQCEISKITNWVNMGANCSN